MHRGTGARDVEHTRRLSRRVLDAQAWRAAAAKGPRAGVTVIEHRGCKSHMLASKLASGGGLEALLDLAIRRHLGED